MNKNLSEKPRLPPELYRPSWFGAAAFISYSVALFIVPAALSRFIVGNDLPMAIGLIAALPLLLLAQQGLHLLGWVGHEGLHLSLARNRHVSTGLGIFFSSMIINFMEVGWATSHRNHHRYTNQKQWGLTNKLATPRRIAVPDGPRPSLRS
jgi:fatty acid desaturase